MTNAVYGFTTMLFKLLDEEQPEYVVVAFDMPAATFRHDAFEAYKAQRAPMPEALRPQVQMMKDVLAALHIPLLGVVGFEADDVIGTLACGAEEAGIDALIVTADRDALQLVDEHIHVLANKRGITDTVLYDRRAVLERYGVAPEQVPDIKALTGDTSDNIPGVPGIGEKTAGKLIAEYGSLENLLEHAEDVPGKVGAALLAHAEQARQSKRLVTIHREVPLENFSWEACRRQPWDQQLLLDLFRRLDFRSLLSRLVAHEITAASAEQEPMAAARVVESIAEIRELAAALAEIGECAMVPVGDGDDPLRHRLVGLAFSAGADLHAYLPLHDVPPEQGNLFAEASAATGAYDRLQALAPFLRDGRVKISGYNLKLLALWLRGQGIEVRGLACDVQIAAYLIDPTTRHTLADLAFDYLHVHTEVPDLSACWHGGDVAVLATAAGHVAQLIRRVEAPLRQALAAGELLPLFHEVEMPLVPILAEMEWLGIALDIPHLQALSDELGAAIRAVEIAIYHLAEAEFAINSPKQLQAILFEKLQLPRGRKTKTGYSTDADTLTALAERHDIVRKILQYRELTKLKSTYVNSLPRLALPPAGRVHTHFNQTVTATGRLSSSDPNLQNIPIRSEEGREIRRAFIPGERDWLLLAADYSQIELRVLAHMTNDDALIEVFRRGEDLHTATACRVFGVTADGVTREMRRMAKVVNFSIPYGTTAFGLAGQLGCSREMAEEFMRTYLGRFPGVANYMEEIVRRARLDGYVSTVCGRRRPLPDLHAAAVTVRQAAERTAINTPIQGSAADIMKLAMVRLARDLQHGADMHAHLLLQVHDEVVLEAPAASVEALASVVRTAMQEAFPLIVPLEVEVKVGPNWRDVSPHVEEEAPFFSTNGALDENPG